MKKIKFRVGIKLFFTMLIMAEVIVAVAIAIFILSELSELLSITLPLYPTVWLLLLSALIGTLSASYINRKIFAPITKLSQSMSQVADGDFTVTLETKSRVKEIQDIYGSFNLMVRELGTTEILQTDFVSNVSHEFKTPINAIEGYTTLLQNGDMSDEERNDYIEKIIFNTKRLSELVSNILLFTKIDNQAIGEKQTRYRLDEQIRQAIVLLEPKWSEKDIEFDVDLERVEYTGAENLMLHVWSNLIDNAVKFDPVGGYLGIKMTKADGVITVAVEDSGPGISDDAKKHVFDKFYQSDSSHKDEGSGLGLALVRRILTACGGEITVSDREGGGSVFTVTLKNND